MRHKAFSSYPLLNEVFQKEFPSYPAAFSSYPAAFSSYPAAFSSYPRSIGCSRSYLVTPRSQSSQLELAWHGVPIQTAASRKTATGPFSGLPSARRRNGWPRQKDAILEPMAMVCWASAFGQPVSVCICCQACGRQAAASRPTIPTSTARRRPRPKRHQAVDQD